MHFKMGDLSALLGLAVICYLAVKFGQWLRGDLKR